MKINEKSKGQTQEFFVKKVSRKMHIVRRPLKEAFLASKIVILD